MIITDLKDAYDYGEFNKEYLLGTVEKTMAQVKHMSGTIEDFRNFFKPGKEKVIFRLNTAVSEVIHLIFDQLTKAHIRIALDCKYDAVRTPGEGKYSGICACEPELTGYGYPNEFKQAILNILVNARDAVVRKRQRGAPTQKRSAEESGEILIELSRTNDTSILEITDSGGGIPAEILQRIFEPYFTTKEGEGTGIGLYMVKVIIEQHMGGAIRASNGSKGAVFTIELPIRA
jgi:signal transduction histidine kinase